MRLLAAFALVPAVVAQDPKPIIPMRPQLEYTRPLRTPDKNLQPPLELYDELRVMRAIARDPAAKVTFDSDGRQVCDSESWRQARAKAEIKATRMGGYLAVVGQESGEAADRALAYYGAFWLDSIQDTLSIMALIPGEPVPAIRDDAIQRALPFLRAHLGKTQGGEGGARAPSPVDYAQGRVTGDRVYQDPNAPAYDFDINPWCALLECEQARDKAQGLWFLRELVTIRKQYGLETLTLVKSLLPGLVVHADQEVRKQARAYLAAVDPHNRPAPPDDAPDSAALAWLESILYELFPPIRKISPGLFELYPSTDLDQIVAAGKDLLSRDAIGSTTTGTVNGVFYRGFKVQRLPKPLDLLQIPLEAVITAINGVPVADSKGLLDTITATLRTKRALVVEFVARDQQRAIEYRLR
jgi:hypothetical protein